MIKKLLLAILVITMCLSLLPTGVSATNEDVSEFQEMIDKAYQIYLTTNEITPISSGEGFYYDSENDLPPYYDPLNETMLYGGSLAEWNATVDDIFTPEAAKKARSAYINSSCPLFIEKEGVIYIAWGVGQRIHFSISYESIYDIELTIIEKDENKVNAKLKVWIPGGYWEAPSTEAYVSCVFEHSDGSWLIGDCAFTDMITSKNFEWTPVESPSTADPAVNSFVILPVISLACLVPAVCLLRRRRRTVA